MPHKHTRKEGTAGSSFNLAPNAIARPLAAYNKSKTKDQAQSRRKDPARKPKPQKVAGYGIDDTPRAFARLMQVQTHKRSHSALDNGDRPARKKRAKTSDPDVQQALISAPPADQTLKLLPGERLADFSARVNQAIPVSGLAKRGKVTIDGLKERRTHKEKKMHKMYAEWRDEDAKIKAQNEELAEKAEEEEEERYAEYGGESTTMPVSKQSKRQRAIGETGQMDDDPWAVLKRKRPAQRALHDVVQAPPDLKVIPTEKFKVRNGAKITVANVPTSAGSLKKREQLSEARMEVIERYRAMMRANNNK